MALSKHWCLFEHSDQRSIATLAQPMVLVWGRGLPVCPTSDRREECSGNLIKNRFVAEAKQKLHTSAMGIGEICCCFSLDLYNMTYSWGKKRSINAMSLRDFVLWTEGKKNCKCIISGFFPYGIHAQTAVVPATQISPVSECFCC